MRQLAEVVEAALSRVSNNPGPDASVMIQFAAGDFANMKAAVASARAELDAIDKHNIADAAEVVSHTSGGQPLPVEMRLDMALDQMDLAAAVQAREQESGGAVGTETTQEGQKS